MRLLIINKRPWVLELIWVLRETRDKDSVLRKKLAADPALDGYNVLTLLPRQYGLGTVGTGDGDLKPWLKARSLASSLKVTSETFCGLFYLRDVTGEPVWWLCAMRSGVISALTDMAFATRDEAESQIVTVKDLLGDFDEMVIKESEEESLAWLAAYARSGFSSYVSSYGRIVPRKLHEARKPLVMGLCIAGAALACGYGLLLFWEHLAGKRAMEVASEALRDREARRAELLANPEREFPQPWKTATTPQNLGATCLPNMLALPTVVSGWELEGATCEKSALALTFGHRTGADYVRLPVGATLGKSPQQAVARLPLSISASGQAISHEVFVSRELATRHLYQITQQAGARLNLAFTQPQKITVDKVDLVAPWMVGTWELADVPAALVLDVSLFAALALPGLTMTRVTMTGTTWSFKGNIYVTQN